MANKKDDKQKLSTIIENSATLGVMSAMTPEERKAMMEYSFDYARRTRRMPDLSEACLMYLAEGEPPARQPEP